VPGEQYADRIRRQAPHLSEEFGTGHSRHPHVGDDDRELALIAAQDAQGLVSVTCDGHVLAAMQHVTEPLAEIRIIVHAQHSR
jgi:hypothetical protein